MKKHPFLIRLLGLTILIVPTLIYLCFLIPALSEEYTVLMSSSGIIGGAGFLGSSKIPVDTKNSSLLKLASNAFTTLVMITLVQEFIMELVFLAVTFITSFIIYKLFEEMYQDAKRRKENEQLSTSISQNIIKTTK